MFADINVVCNTDPQIIDLVNSVGLKPIINNNSHLGMSESIKLGINASTGKRGYLIALADMPYVKTSTIETVCQSLKVNNIALPYSDHRAGNPVAFGLEFKESLLALTGDQGAKSIVLAHQDVVEKVGVKDPGIWHDIDVPSDVIA